MYNSRDKLIKKLEERAASWEIGFTPITLEQVQNEVAYLDNLDHLTDTDYECLECNLTLLALLEEGYSLLWGTSNDIEPPTLYINGDRRQWNS